jgi:hypothetical protein
MTIAFLIVSALLAISEVLAEFKPIEENNIFRLIVKALKYFQTSKKEFQEKTKNE